MMMTFNYYYLERFAYPAYFFTVALLMFVLLVGKVMSGSQRWLSLGPVVFQPSELAKISMVLVLAKFFGDRGDAEEYRLRDLWQPFILILVPCGLILKEPDLGTALFLGMALLGVLVASVGIYHLSANCCTMFSKRPENRVDDLEHGVGWVPHSGSNR